MVSIVNKIYCLNFIVSYLYFFDRFIDPLFFKAIYFNLTLDIGVCYFNHANKFVSIYELTQSREDKVSCKGMTERFLFSFFDSPIMSQIVERACTVKLFYF